MTERISVGIIGAGTIAGRGHIPGYLDQPDARLTAVCDVVGERASLVAEELGAGHVCEDYRELLELDDVDAVSVCTPNKFHAPIAIAALRAGKHVLCEKPPAMSADEAQAMVDAAQANDRVLMICLNNRFQPEIQLLKQYIEDGELGRVYYAKTGILRRRGSAGGWFSEKSISGGGALIDIGVHCLDWTWWLMGCPQPLQVYGQVYQEIGSYHLTYETSWTPADLEGKAKAQDWAGDTDELAIATICLANGATMRVEVSWALNNEKTIQYTELYGNRAGARLSPLTIFGQERGRLVDNTPHVPEQDGARTHSLAIRHFLDCIRTGEKPLTTPEQIVDLMRILDAIYESAQKGGLVKLG
jgi:predicted dehydrogenase